MSIEQAELDFKEAQRIKSVGKLYKSGHRANLYAIVENEVLKVYLEESRERADWKDNLDFLPVYDKVTKAWYHKGFHINAMLAIEEISTIKDFQSMQIWSYSQGAAVAQIVSEHIYADSLITFGCPNNVFMNRRIKKSRLHHKHYVQGFDIVAYGIFWLKKYGKVIKLPSIGSPFKNHEYYWLNK